MTAHQTPAAATVATWHHAGCYQTKGVPEGMPPDTCDCATLLMFEAFAAYPNPLMSGSVTLAVSKALRDERRRAEGILSVVRAVQQEWRERTGHPDCRDDEDCVGCAADDLDRVVGRLIESTFR